MLYLAGMAFALYGWSNLQLTYHWDIRWAVVGAALPLSMIAGVVPRIVRWQQLRRSATQPADPTSPVEVPPAV